MSDGSSLQVTTNHPFYVDASSVRGQAGWVQAGDLRVGDHMRTISGIDLVVSSLKYQVGTAHVYTLTVAQDHTFFVGDGVPILVHNCLIPQDATGRISIGLSQGWQRRLPVRNIGDEFVYTLRDGETSAMLKVGSTAEVSGRTLIGRFEPYAKAGGRLKLQLELELWRIERQSGTNLVRIEGEFLARILGAENDLPWDNSLINGAPRLGRPGPGVPWICDSRLAKLGYSWGNVEGDSTYGKYLDPNGNVLGLNPNYFPWTTNSVPLHPCR